MSQNSTKLKARDLDSIPTVQLTRTLTLVAFENRTGTAEQSNAGEQNSIHLLDLKSDFDLKESQQSAYRAGLYTQYQNR